MLILRPYNWKDESEEGGFQTDENSWQILVKFISDHSVNAQMKEEAERWFSVSTGYVVYETDAQEVADLLQRLLEKGIVQKHEREVRIQHPPYSCECCNGSGFETTTGGKCPLCAGDGVIRRVYFSEQIIIDFIQFLRNCRGFIDWTADALFPAIYGPHWKDLFSSGDAISKLFREIGIVNEEIIQVTPAPNMAPDRLTIFVTTRNAERGIETRGIIDFITGNPTWEQFIDVTYGIGVNTDLKIIVNDGERFLNFCKPAGGYPAITNLVARNNRCGVRTFLVGVRMERRKEGPTVKYETHQRPYSEQNPPLDTLPTKRQVQEAEFWVAYYYAASQARDYIGESHDIINDYHPHFSMKGLKIISFWTDEGLSLNAIPENESDTLWRIWDQTKEILMEKYPGCSVEFKPMCDGKTAISVRVDKLPMCDLFNMKPEDKYHYGDKVVRGDLDFLSVISHILASVDGEDEEEED